MTDARNFLLNTDYPMDKIVYINSGSFTAGSNQYNLTVPHQVLGVSPQLDYLPLPIFQWSFDSDFSTCYEVTDRPIELYPPGFPFACTIYSNKSSFGAYFVDLSMTDLPTVYWRLLFFVPSDDNPEIEPLSQNADSFIINTDYNYPKLFMSGVAAENEVVTHGLGFVPQCMVWAESSNSIATVTYYGYGISASPDITSTTLTFPYIDGTFTFHYRIYYDE